MSDDKKEAAKKAPDEKSVSDDGETGNDNDGKAKGKNSAAKSTESAPPKGLKAKLLKNKMLVIGIMALILIGGGGAGLYFMGVFTPKETHEVTLALPPAPVFQEIPKITVDLKPSPGHRRPFIRLTMQAELQGESARTAFIDKEAKILDALHTHLRTLTVEDLAGAQGTIRLRADILRVINNIIKPEIAISVLYKDIMIR